MVIAVSIVTVGLIASLNNLDILTGTIWDHTWPVILIVLGLFWLLSGFFEHRHCRLRGWKVGAVLLFPL